MSAEKMVLWAMGLLVLAGFCAVGCGGEAEPGDEYATHVAQGINDGATPREPWQTQCPVCGDPISPDYHTASEKDRVYFCSQECLQKWEKDPSAYAGSLKKQQEGEGEGFLPPGVRERE